MAKKKKEHKIINEFKAFISRGNVVDLAVGVIIGGAFTAIVTALTSNILQPIINWVLSLIFGGDALASARTILGKTVYQLTEAGEVIVDANGKGLIDWSSTIYIDWGAFVSAIINFFLIAIVLFLIVKLINTAKAKAEKVKAAELEKYYNEHPEERPKPADPGVPVPTELDVLTEIRDLLSKKEGK